MADNKRIPELPPRSSTDGTMILPVYRGADDITYGIPLSDLLPEISETSNEWDPGVTYAEDDIVVFEDQLYVSLQDSNLDNLPSDVGSTFWTIGVKSQSGLVPYAPGIFTDAEVTVLKEVAPSVWLLYYLASTTRPYNSTDFATEALAGDWLPVGAPTGIYWPLNGSAEASGTIAIEGVNNNLSIDNFGNILIQTTAPGSLWGYLSLNPSDVSLGVNLAYMMFSAVSDAIIAYGNLRLTQAFTIDSLPDNPTPSYSLTYEPGPGTVTRTPFVPDRFKGKYATLGDLNTAVPSATIGDYAQVDAGGGSNVILYLWDNEEGWVIGGGGVINASGIVFAPAGGISAIEVQAAIEELDAEKTDEAYVDDAIAQEVLDRDAAISSALSGLTWKNVRVATTANIVLTAPQTIDGVVVIATDRVLAKNQTVASQNGIYICAAGAWSRATDADINSELQNAAVLVAEGTTNANSSWVQTQSSINIGSTSIIFQQLGSSVPNADASTRGIAKLYTSLGTNTDGGIDQSTAKTNFDLKETASNKDASGGYAGLTLFKINFKNVANTFISFFTNTNTAARTYTFQDRNGTIADDTDLSGKQSLDATLTALAGLATGANKIPYSTGTDTFSQLDFKDEDDMSSDSATALPSQQSVKAYVDSHLNYWRTLPGSPTRSSNTVLTITDISNAGKYDLLFSRGTILKWTDSGSVKMAMVVSATYLSGTVTITIVGDVLAASATMNTFAYAILKATSIMFAIAGTMAAGTNLSRKWKADKSYRVFGADASHGTAGTTNPTVYDVNKNGVSMFTTKVSVASAALSGNGFTADDGVSLVLDDAITIDCDSFSTTPPVDAYIDLFVFPTNNQYL